MRAGGDEDAQTQEDPHAPGRWEGREGDQHEHGDRGEAGPPASLRVATITTVTFACMREVIRFAKPMPNRTAGAVAMLRPTNTPASASTPAPIAMAPMPIRRPFMGDCNTVDATNVTSPPARRT